MPPVLSLLLEPTSSTPPGVNRSTSVPKVVIVTLLDLLLGGASGVNWSVSFLLDFVFNGKECVDSDSLLETSGRPLTLSS